MKITTILFVFLNVSSHVNSFLTTKEYGHSSISTVSHIFHFILTKKYMNWENQKKTSFL